MAISTSPEGAASSPSRLTLRQTLQRRHSNHHSQSQPNLGFLRSTNFSSSSIDSCMAYGKCYNRSKTFPSTTADEMDLGLSPKLQHDDTSVDPQHRMADAVQIRDREDLAGDDPYFASQKKKKKNSRPGISRQLSHGLATIKSRFGELYDGYTSKNEPVDSEDFALAYGPYYRPLKETKSHNEQLVHGLNRVDHLNQGFSPRDSPRSPQGGLENHGDLRDLDEAILQVEDTLKTLNAEDTGRALNLSNLGSLLAMRYERKRRLYDLEKAIEHITEASNIECAKPTVRAAILNNLGNCLEMRFQRISEITDLEAAINLTRRALEMTHADPQHRGQYWHNLGSRQMMKYERTADISDLNVAINAIQQSLRATPTGHADEVTIRNTLASFLQKRFDRTGDIEDLQQAIETLEIALREMHDDSHNYAMVANGMAILLEKRFERLGQEEDLEAAIEMRESF